MVLVAWHLQRHNECLALGWVLCKRKAKVSLRFSAANDELDTRSGSLGICVNEGGAKSINEATEKIVRNFFTRRMGVAEVPRIAALPKTQTGNISASVRKFFAAVEAVNVDGADDERLAWQEGLHDGLTPNARFIARDKSHGARRLPRSLS
jgi:hypothetical protein